MKKIIIAAVLFCFIFHSVRAQLTLVDSLKMEIRATTNDTVRLVLLSKLTSHYFELDFEQLGIYSKPMLHLAKKLGYKIEEAYAMQLI